MPEEKSWLRGIRQILLMPEEKSWLRGIRLILLMPEEKSIILGIPPNEEVAFRILDIHFILGTRAHPSYPSVNDKVTN